MRLRTDGHIISLKKEPRPSIRKYILTFIWLIIVNAQADKETVYLTKVL